MAERKGTIRNGAANGEPRAAGGVFSSSVAGSAQRSSGGFGGKPPLGGGFPPNQPTTDGEKRSAGQTAKRDEVAAWVAEHLPTCHAVASEFRSVLGEVRLVYASENGHALGNENAGRQPCDACYHFFRKLLSPDGARQQRACRLYRYAANRCADYREEK